MPCKKCARCCFRYPCDITFEELPGIAKKLNLSIGEFFDKYLLWDFYIGDDDVKEQAYQYYIVFRRSNRKEEINHTASWSWAMQFESPCIFLTKDNLCSIHDFKPESGRRQECSGDQKYYVSKKVKADAWVKKAKELGLPGNYHEFNVDIFYK